MQGTLGQYYLIRPLQTQLVSLNFARAQLYLAQAGQDETLLVVKLLSTIAGKIEQELFLNEIKVLQQLSAVDSCYWLHLRASGQAIFNVESSDLKPELMNYMVLPYIEQGNVKQALNNASYNLQQAGHLWLGMLEAVDALHHQGWLHLDIKPANFLLNSSCGSSSSVCLIDFALAQPAVKLQVDIGGQAAHITKTKGTPRYMSPEQFLGQPLNTQTDFYSLGLILYELLTGKNVYHANNYQGWAMQHCQKPVPLLPQDLAEFQTFIDGLLAKNRSNRFMDSFEIRQIARQTFKI